MERYEVIIFDLDGTLSNSEEGITKSVQYSLGKMGIKEDCLDNLKHFIGPPLKDEFQKKYICYFHWVRKYAGLLGTRECRPSVM